MNTEMVNLVNAFEVIVESVSDNHLSRLSMFARPDSPIPSFRRAR